MTKQIHDYTAANSIDAQNDYLLIDPSSSGIYKKINRNVFLGITGNPIGTSDTQTLTSKTIGNTNAITQKDGSFTLQNTSDTTKQAVFSLASITTGNTRTYTLPDASVTLVGTTSTQTLTSKTLTSPAISGGTIDNSTITVDSLAGHTSATTVTVANLQIVNGVLNTANSVTATAIAAGAVQPQALVSGTGSGWSWSTWSPSWTNLTVGNGTLVARYIQMGKTVVGQLNLTFGSSTSVSGNAIFTLPVTSVNSYLSGASPIGHADFFNTGVASYPGAVMWVSTTSANLVTWNATSTYTQDSNISSTVPFTWTTGSKLGISFIYEAA